MAWPVCGRSQVPLEKQGFPRGVRGPEPRLTLESEGAFKQKLEFQQDVGNCVSTERMGQEAAKWGKRLGIERGVGGRKWVKGFFKRNPGLQRANRSWGRSVTYIL